MWSLSLVQSLKVTPVSVSIETSYFGINVAMVTSRPSPTLPVIRCLSCYWFLKSLGQCRQWRRLDNDLVDVQVNGRGGSDRWVKLTETYGCLAMIQVKIEAGDIWRWLGFISRCDEMKSLSRRVVTSLLDWQHGSSLRNQSLFTENALCRQTDRRLGSEGGGGSYHRINKITGPD